MEDLSQQHPPNTEIVITERDRNVLHLLAIRPRTRAAIQSACFTGEEASTRSTRRRLTKLVIGGYIEVEREERKSLEPRWEVTEAGKRALAGGTAEENELKILRALQDFARLTRDEIQKLVFPSRTRGQRTREQLKSLRERGLVKRHSAAGGWRDNSKRYKLTDRGLREVGLENSGDS